MKILEAKGELVEQKSYPGLFECKMTHKIKETSASFHYIGPKFTVEMWDEILAFFKWSYTKTHGETQVRLFVHPTQGWKAWAFPQEASTGLSTHEMPDSPETKSQRAQFGDEWIPYGTVHHHCSASAFQSGVDEHNEKDQEGLHITVGNIDKEDAHSLHFRFYYRGCKFQPDMSEFWDVGEQCAAKAKELSEYFGITVDLNVVAESQMAQTCAKDANVPEQWMANLIEKPVEKFAWEGERGVNHSPYGGTGGGYYGACEDQGYKGYPSRAIKMLRRKYRSGYKEEIKELGGLTPELREEIDTEIMTALECLEQDSEVMFILEALGKHNCDLTETIKKFEETLVAENGKLEAVLSEEEKEDAAEELAELTGHLPGDYFGH